MNFSMCKETCQYWTGSLATVQDFEWLKEVRVPKGSVNIHVI